MNYLIGDIGNTNIKICKINSNFKIINTYLFETKKSNFETNLNRRLKKKYELTLAEEANLSE